MNANGSYDRVFLDGPFLRSVSGIAATQHQQQQQQVPNVIHPPTDSSIKVAESAAVNSNNQRQQTNLFIWHTLSSSDSFRLVSIIFMAWLGVLLLKRFF
jgi:hypothetical protein